MICEVPAFGFDHSWPPKMPEPGLVIEGLNHLRKCITYVAFVLTDPTWHFTHFANPKSLIAIYLYTIFLLQVSKLLTDQMVVQIFGSTRRLPIIQNGTISKIVRLFLPSKMSYNDGISKIASDMKGCQNHGVLVHPKKWQVDEPIIRPDGSISVFWRRW